MKNIIIIGTASLLLITGCASRMPNTMPTYMPGDSERSCTSLIHEMGNIENEMNRKWGERNQQITANIALGVVGAFLIVPWFFMDMSGAERTEWESYKKRFDYLSILLSDKKCPPYKSVIVDTNTSMQKEEGKE